MTDLGATFDATQVEPTGEFEQLPAGEYEAQIIESRREPVSKDDPTKGECLGLTWKVMSGPLEGRLFWQRILLWFSGAEKAPGRTVEIAQQQLSSLCHATGQMALSDTEQLHYRPCLVRYGPQKNNPQFSEVKSVKASGGAASAPGGRAPEPPFGAPPAQSPGAPSGGPSGGGWKRRAG